MVHAHTFCLLFVFCLLAFWSARAVAEGPPAAGGTPPPDAVTELVWPDGAPGALGNNDADKPTLTLFPAAKEKATGTAVVVCPGGGYGGHAMDYEGYDVARWFNANGISAFVLRYRVAPYRHPAPLMDAQRALRIVRSRAKEWNIGTKKIGILGFSAGGHLASTTGTHFDAGNPDAKDPIDRVSSRPDFMILIYPVITFRPPYTHLGSRENLLGKDPDPALITSLSNDEQVTKDTPPAFLVTSSGDTAVPAENSVQFYLAMRKAGVPAELHVYEKGEHGYGMGKGDPILSTWTRHCIDWLHGRGF